jgi:hypothetical protein
MGKRDGNAVMADKRFRERKSRHEVGRGAKGKTRLLAKPKRLIEPAQDGFCHIPGMKPPLEACAWQIVELTDAFQAKPPQKEGDFRLEPQSLYGKSTKRFADLSVGYDGWRACRIAGKRMRPS